MRKWSTVYAILGSRRCIVNALPRNIRKKLKLACAGVPE
jgi:hypothetical protein